jgi:hypothetical protein
MKKIAITISVIITFIISCVISYYAGYYHVIHNQYAEQCPNDDNTYYIIIDGNIHEYNK